MKPGLECPDVRTGLELAANSDSKLVLLVSSNPETVQRAGQLAADALGWRTVRLSVALGNALAAHMPDERPALAWEALMAVVGDHDDGVVLVGTDLLWEPSLGFDAYRALRRVGRGGPTVATWFGTVDGLAISRAEPGHTEYTRDRLDVPYVVAVAESG